MFGPNIYRSPLNIGKIIGGLSKTLNVVNQVIPIYKDAKPLINNAKNAFSVIKEVGTNTTNRIRQNTEKNVKPIKEKINNNIQDVKLIENKKGPTFFL